MTNNHYSAGSISGIAATGFNIADVSSVAALNALPAGMKGAVWVADNPGNTASFRAFVTPFFGNPKLHSFRFSDEPDPLGRYGKLRITHDQMKAQNDYIHANGAKSFVTMMDLGSYEAPSLVSGYLPSSGIDYVGLDPYPIRGLAQDIQYIARMVSAALAVGWTKEQIIPVFQAFGGGTYTTTTGGQTDKYVLPSVAQMNAMFALWNSLIPNPDFDMAWTYETKSGITSIASTTAPALELREAFRLHNQSVVAPPPPVLTIDGQPATQERIDDLVAARNAAEDYVSALDRLLDTING